jgi:hypothetical protein
MIDTLNKKISPRPTRQPKNKRLPINTILIGSLHSSLQSNHARSGTVPFAASGLLRFRRFDASLVKW